MECSPARSIAASSSFGVTSLSHRCVPRGNHPSKYSAPTIASAKLLRVRLMVAAIISPLGFTIAAQLSMKARTSATCSTTSMASTRSNHRRRIDAR